MHLAGQQQLGAALAPRAIAGWDAAQHAAAEEMVTRNVDELVAGPWEALLCLEDEGAFYADPDRMEDRRVEAADETAVASVAQAQGIRSDDWIERWSDLVQERFAALDVHDSVAAIDKSRAHMGVPFPVLPDAAWPPPTPSGKASARPSMSVWRPSVALGPPPRPQPNAGPARDPRSDPAGAPTNH